MNELHKGLERYLSQKERDILAKARIGIAGLGGLGSNACMLLARCGIENFYLVDYDTIDASNLNRQLFFPKDVGKLKATVLCETLYALNPNIHPSTYTEPITQENVDSIISNAPIWIEALDGANDKAMLVGAAIKAGCPIVSASGIAGYGGPPLQRKKMQGLVIVGDYTSDIKDKPPLAPRVAWAAAMLADSILEILLEK